MQRIVSIVVAVATVIPSQSSASVLWRGDFETGDISQWTRAQQVSPDRLQVVESPVREGRYALRAEVRNGDNPIGASGHRNELVLMTNETEGDERYYSWSTLWPEDYPFYPTWQLFTQWHHSGPSGAPPVRFVLGCSAADCGQPMPDTMFFIVSGQGIWTEKVVPGKWHDFVLHVKWSSNPQTGFVELWYDGNLVVPKQSVATLFPGQTNYLKQGLYRDAATQPTQVVYHDGFTIGTTLEDVMPPVTPDSEENADIGEDNMEENEEIVDQPETSEEVRESMPGDEGAEDVENEENEGSQIPVTESGEETSANQPASSEKKDLGKGLARCSMGSKLLSSGAIFSLAGVAMLRVRKRK